MLLCPYGALVVDTMLQHCMRLRTDTSNGDSWNLKHSKHKTAENLAEKPHSRKFGRGIK